MIFWKSGPRTVGQGVVPQRSTIENNLEQYTAGFDGDRGPSERGSCLLSGCVCCRLWRRWWQRTIWERVVSIRRCVTCVKCRQSSLLVWSSMHITRASRRRTRSLTTKNSTCETSSTTTSMKDLYQSLTRGLAWSISNMHCSRLQCTRLHGLLTLQLCQVSEVICRVIGWEVNE